MTWASRARMFFGLIMVLVIVAGSTFVFTQRQQRTTSMSATIEAESHPVGAEYAGLVMEQYVSLGDVVERGDPLFEIHSIQLERDIELEAVEPTDDVSEDGTFVVRAPVDGVVAEMEAVEGGFAYAGGVLAYVDRAGSHFVEATFLLTPRDFDRIHHSSHANLIMPDQTTFQGSVDSVSVVTVQGDAEVTTRILSDDLVNNTANGLLKPGTPVQVNLYLRDDGILAGFNDTVKDFLARIGL